MIENIIIASLWCFGIYAAFDSRHLLGRLGGWLQRTIGITACRPLFLCPTCMGSIHGLCWGLYFYADLRIIPFIICLAGLNYIIITLLPEYEEPIQKERD